MKNAEYIPYGPEWEKEMMKLPKSVLIEKIREILLKLKNSKVNHQ